MSDLLVGMRKAFHLLYYSCLRVCVNFKLILDRILDDTGNNTHPNSGSDYKTKPKKCDSNYNSSILIRPR